MKTKPGHDARTTALQKKQQYIDYVELGGLYRVNNDKSIASCGGKVIGVISGNVCLCLSVRGTFPAGYLDMFRESLLNRVLFGQTISTFIELQLDKAPEADYPNCKIKQNTFTRAFLFWYLENHISKADLQK